MVQSESGVKTLLCEAQTLSHKGQYELTWDPKAIARKRRNHNGTYGWAIVRRSSNAVYGCGTRLRIHLCAHNPCGVGWADSTYGHYGPPVHMQPITCMGPAAAPLLPPAAAPLFHLTAAPVAEPLSAAQSTAENVAEPSSAQTAVAAPTDETDDRIAAMGRIHAAALNLAREIRKPQACVGYIAFVLFALLKRCRPQVWEGSNKFCFIEQFAPWAKDMCPTECAYAAIPCALKRNASGVVEYMQISEQSPLSKMSHYVAGIDIPRAKRRLRIRGSTISAPMTAIAAGTRVDESAFAAFYRNLGAHYLPTVCDGDCGLDVMCLILGIERSLYERNSLRAELSDYLLQRLHLPWMIDILSVTQELNPDDVKLARSDDVQRWHELMPNPGAFETAVAAIARDDGGESRANALVKRKACRRCLPSPCRATVGGSRPAFEEEWDCTTPAKKRKIGIDCETAVAESQPAPSDDNEEQPVAAAAATAVAAAARNGWWPGRDMPGRNGWWPAIQNVAEYE